MRQHPQHKDIDRSPQQIGKDKTRKSAYATHTHHSKLSQKGFQQVNSLIGRDKSLQ
jgi:hypothetical protein